MKDAALKTWDKMWPLLILVVCGWWFFETAADASCKMHGSRGLSILLNKLCEAGGSWLAAVIPGIIFAAALVGVWFFYRSK